MSCERSEAPRAVEQLGVLLVRGAPELGQQLAARGCQEQRVRAPVVGVAAALGEPALLEVVDQRDHGAAVDPQRDAQGLLGLPLGGGEMAEHSEVPRVQAAAGEPLREATVRVGAQLHEQEAGAAARVRGSAGTRAMVPRAVNCS